MGMLTFVHLGELRGARWDEIDMKIAEWRIPPVRMKMNTEHIVPLSRQSITVLRDIEPLTGKSELVFHGKRTRKQPISNNHTLTKTKAKPVESITYIEEDARKH
jgi:integrase